MILWIDDDSVRLRAVADWLAASGFEVKMADDIDSALSLLSVHGRAVQLILLDLMIPYKNPNADSGRSKEYLEAKRGGLWFLQAFRHMGFDLSPRLKVIILSVVGEHRFDEDVKRFGLDRESLGIAAYVQKPSSLPELEQTIRRVMET